MNKFDGLSVLLLTPAVLRLLTLRCNPCLYIKACAELHPRLCSNIELEYLPRSQLLW